MNAAQGSHIQFLDADDLLHPQKLSLQLAAADHGLSTRDLLTSAWGRFFVHTERAVFHHDALWQTLSPVDWIVTKFTANTFMFPASWLVSRKLMELARQAGVEGMYLEVRPSNLRALALYERAGFELLGRRRGYYRARGGTEDAVVLVHRFRRRR